MSTRRQKSSASPRKPKAAATTGYTPELAARICERIATSELGMEEVLEEIRADTGYAPCLSTIWRWRKGKPQFYAMEEDARLQQARLLHDRAQKYAREAMQGRVEKIVVKPDGSKESTITIADNVERSKLLVQTTLKRAGQLDGKRFGDKVQQEVSGPGGGPVQAEIKVMFVKPTGQPAS